jgi:pimeloyl-ACP methyl ester carboxylesterase
MGWKSRAGGVIAIVAAALLVPIPAQATGPRPAPTWGACPVPGPDPRQQCATIRVPLDYRRPHGRTIEITISRVLTAKPELRRGILLSNPGGPGGSGLDLPSALAELLPSEVTDRYDLIGFDPRGIAHSTPVSCGIPADTPIDLIIPAPAPDGSIDRNVAHARTTAAGCATHSGDLLPFITTANTARDMDAIRQVLGEPKLSYLGYSYGSYLGAVYRSLFPHRSDRIILDSAVDPTRVWYHQWRAWSLGFDLRFPDFTAWAAARHSTFGLGATPAAVARTYDDLTARLDREPVPVPGVGVIDGNFVRLVTFSALYSDSSFPELATIWQALSAPDGGAAAGLASSDLLRRAPASAVIPADNFRASQVTVLCGDVAWPRDVATYQRAVTADRARHPRTAGFPANIWPCAFWRYPPVEPPVAVTGTGQRNVLILQNLRDPATPWTTGFGLRRVMGRTAAMVSVDQGGHGVYLFSNAPCASDVATAFLVSGALPSSDRFCPGQSPLAAATRATTRLRLPGPLG